MVEWDLLLTGANIATMATDKDYGAITDAAIAISGGCISYAGQVGGLPPGRASRTCDLGGQWVTPGLIDCHTHLIYGGSRVREFEMRLAGATYLEIAEAGGGIHSSVKATRAASQETLFATARERLKTMLSEGVTTVEIKSGYGLDRHTELRMLRVARSLGEAFPVTIRTTYLGGHMVPKEFADDRDGYVDLVCSLIEEVKADGSADAFDVCYDPIGFDRKHCERMLTQSSQAGLPVKLHTGQFASQGGGELAAAFHALSADHLDYFSENDARAMAASGTVAVLLPGASYFVREKTRPQIDLLRHHGVAIALATDHNPGSSPLLSLTLTMNMGAILFGLTAPETLAGVTRNAAKALGLSADRGTIEAGKRADLAVWAIEHPSELSYSIGSTSASGVIRGGEIVRNAGAFQA